MKFICLLFIFCSYLCAENAFGALSIGVTHVHLKHINRDYSNYDSINQNSSLDFSSQRSAVYFSLKRGAFFADSNVLWHFSLNGSAGANHKNGLYSIGGDAGLGYKMFHGHLMPFVAIGYEGLNIALPYHTNKQFNLWNPVLSIDLFIEIMDNKGISIGFQKGIQSHATIDENKVRFSHNRFNVSLSFYDFSL